MRGVDFEYLIFFFFVLFSENEASCPMKEMDTKLSGV